MKIPNRVDIAKFFDPIIYKVSEKLSKQVVSLKLANNKLKDTILKENELNKDTKDKLSDEINILTKQIKKCENDMLMELESPIDNFLDKITVKIDNIAYKGKRYYKTEEIRLYLNQLITPKAYEVLSAKSEVDKSDDDREYVERLGNWLAQHVKWTSDKETSGKVDYLTYPEEVLVYQKDDCEGHAFVMASFTPTIVGVCYGFLTQNGKRFGHAWNVLLYKDEIYHVETTGSRVNIYPWSEEKYEPHFVVTKDNTYQLKTGVSFGKLANKIET